MLILPDACVLARGGASMTHCKVMAHRVNNLTEMRPRATRWRTALVVLAALSLGAVMARADVDLLQRYPTTLEAGDTAAERARPWQFAAGDIFQISGFKNKMAGNLRVETGVSDLALGHCADGVVWALILPRENGKLFSPATNNEEGVAHVWLRFHPSLLNVFFPPQS